MPYPARKTVSESAKVICKAINEPAFLQQLMEKQAEKVNSIYASPHWKEAVLSLYK